MALVRFGQGVAEMRGSIGGTTFSRNASAAYARNRVTGSNPMTPEQTANREVFGQLSSGWGALTVDQRDSWIAAAAGELGQRTNKIGDVIQLSGQQLFVAVNRVRLLFGLTQLNGAPAPGTNFPSIVFASSTSEFDAGTAALESLAVTLDLDVATAAMLIYASPVSSGGLARYQSAQERLIAALPTVADNVSEDLFAAYTAVHGTPSVEAGNVIWMRAAPVILQKGIIGPSITFPVYPTAAA